MSSTKTQAGYDRLRQQHLETVGKLSLQDSELLVVKEHLKEAAEKAQAADGGLGLWDREGFFCGVLWLSLVGGGPAGLFAGRLGMGA